MNMERMMVDVGLTAEFHLACVKKDEDALKTLVEKLGKSRIGFMTGRGEFVDNTLFYTDRNGVPVFIQTDRMGKDWDGWRGDLIWTERSDEDTQEDACDKCTGENCPVKTKF